MERQRIINALRYARPAVVSIVGAQDADDCLQDAALKAWKCRRQFRRESKYETWFTRIAINAALMHKRKRVLEQLGDWDAADVRTPEVLAGEAERAQRLYEAILTLTPKRRSAAVRCLREEPYRDAADKAARHKMREELRRRLVVENV